MAFRFEGELIAYRIVREGIPPFDGAGAYRWGSRRTSPGLVCDSCCQKLAIPENLVHFNLGELPPHLIVVQLRIPPTVAHEVRRLDRRSRLFRRLVRIILK
jgi:hypothetical protein